MDAVTPPFFVYGTLRPGGANHDRFLRGRTDAQEPARLGGAVLFDGPGFPYAVEEAGGVVRGELVTVRAQVYGDLLDALDRLEEYVPGDPRSLYHRVERDVVRDADGVPVRAWVYLAAPAVAARLRARGVRIAGGDWWGRAGARPDLSAPGSSAATAPPAPPPPPVPRTP